jgi:hypothetical protein
VKDFATIPLTPELELSIAQNAVADRFVLLGRLSPKFPDWFLARVGRSDRIAALRYRRTPTPGKKEVFEFSLVATYIFVEGPQGTAGNRRASGVRGTAGAGGRTGITPTPTSVPAAKSKVCPQCKRRFDADSRFCSHDRSVLVLEGE